MDRRPAALGQFLGRNGFEDIGAQPFAEGDDAAPGADLRRAGGRPEHPVAAKPAVDPVGLAELVDLVNRGLRRPAQPHRLGLAAQLDEAGQLGPPGEGHAAVSPRRAAATDVALENGDVAGGIALLDAQRGPQADVAASEDRHVGPSRPLENGSRGCVGEGLLQPQGTMRGARM
jgi:hypothetical protein